MGEEEKQGVRKNKDKVRKKTRKERKKEGRKGGRKGSPGLYYLSIFMV